MLPYPYLAAFSVLFTSLAHIVHCAPDAAATPAPKPRLNCTEERLTDLPRMGDCLALSRLIKQISNRPGEGYLKRWGRSQLDLPVGRTAHLPKKYFSGRLDPTGVGPSSCMLYVDDNPLEGRPNYDDFKLRAIADVGERLTIRCLIDQGEGGFDFPGSYGTVYTRLMRFSMGENAVGVNLTSMSGNLTSLGTEVVGNETLTLYEESLTNPDGKGVLTQENVNGGVGYPSTS